MKYYYFKEEDLKPLIKEGVALSPNKHQWMISVLTSMRDMVTKDPINYRSFGMYWWSIKSLMINQGLLSNQYTVDNDIVKEVSLGSELLDVAAALSFHQQSFDSQSSKNNSSSVFNKDGESMDYMLLDDDFEMMIFINNK